MKAISTLFNHIGDTIKSANTQRRLLHDLHHGKTIADSFKENYRAKDNSLEIDRFIQDLGILKEEKNLPKTLKLGSFSQLLIPKSKEIEICKLVFEILSIDRNWCLGPPQIPWLCFMRILATHRCPPLRRRGTFLAPDVLVRGDR